MADAGDGGDNGVAHRGRAKAQETRGQTPRDGCSPGARRGAGNDADIVVTKITVKLPMKGSALAGTVTESALQL